MDLFSLVVGLSFPAFYATTHFLMFSLPGTWYTVLSLTGLHWSETGFCKREIRGSGEMVGLTKLSVRREVGQH